jgi:hypothetical protein
MLHISRATSLQNKRGETRQFEYGDS